MGLLPGGKSCHGAPVAAEGESPKQVKLYT